LIADEDQRPQRERRGEERRGVLRTESIEERVQRREKRGGQSRAKK
jgi:hypothetical protein